MQLFHYYSVEIKTEKEVGFKSLKENIDTTTPQGKFMVTVFGAVAELEVEYTRERQREGIDIALRDKRAYGRPKSLSDEEIEAAYQEYKSSNYTKGIYERLGVSKATFYRLMKEWEGKIII